MMHNAVAVNERWVLQWFCFIRLKYAGYGYFFVLSMQFLRRMDEAAWLVCVCEKRYC